MPSDERAKQAGGDVVGNRTRAAQAKAAGRYRIGGPCDLLELPLYAPLIVGHGKHMGVERVCLRRGHDRVPTFCEQRAVVMRFKMPDMLGNCRLRYVQLPRRLGERLRPICFQERGDPIIQHGATPHVYKQLL